MAAVEEDADVEGPGGEAPRLGRARGTRPPERRLDRLHLLEQRARRQRGLDRDDAVEVPARLVPRPARLALPGLGLVERGGADDLDGLDPREPLERLTEQRQAIAEVRA